MYGKKIDILVVIVSFVVIGFGIEKLCMVTGWNHRPNWQTGPILLTIACTVLVRHYARNINRKCFNKKFWEYLASDEYSRCITLVETAMKERPNEWILRFYLKIVFGLSGMVAQFKAVEIPEVLGQDVYTKVWWQIIRELKLIYTFLEIDPIELSGRAKIERDYCTKSLTIAIVQYEAKEFDLSMQNAIHASLKEYSFIRCVSNLVIALIAKQQGEQPRYEEYMNIARSLSPSNEVDQLLMNFIH